VQQIGGVVSHNIPFKKGVRSTTDRDNILHASVAVGVARKFPFFAKMATEESRNQEKKALITFLEKYFYRIIVVETEFRFIPQCEIFCFNPRCGTWRRRGVYAWLGKEHVNTRMLKHTRLF
jgi:hypothetical protein